MSWSRLPIDGKQARRNGQAQQPDNNQQAPRHAASLRVAAPFTI